MRREPCGSRVGSLAASDSNRRTGLEWGAMSAEQRAHFQRVADDIEAQRSQLMQKPLTTKNAKVDRTEDGISLSDAQIKRLNVVRLDKTLSSMASHCCWQRGLRIYDHISPLCAARVCMPETMSEFASQEQEYRAAFGYDPVVAENPPDPTPAFQRACNVPFAGVCLHDETFSRVKSLVEQLNGELQKRKLGSSSLIILLRGSDEQEHWSVMAGVCLRPLCHILVRCHREGDQLCLSRKDARLHVATMHRLVRTLLRAHSARGPEPGDLAVHVPWLCLLFSCRLVLLVALSWLAADCHPEVCVYSDLQLADHADFRMKVPDNKAAEFRIGSGAAPSSAKPAAAARGAPRLPFGMEAFVPKKARAKKPGALAAKHEEEPSASAPASSSRPLPEQQASDSKQLLSGNAPAPARQLG